MQRPLSPSSLKVLESGSAGINSAFVLVVSSLCGPAEAGSRPLGAKEGRRDLSWLWSTTPRPHPRPTARPACCTGSCPNIAERVGARGPVAGQPNMTEWHRPAGQPRSRPTVGVLELVWDAPVITMYWLLHRYSEQVLLRWSVAVSVKCFITKRCDRVHQNYLYHFISCLFSTVQSETRRGFQTVTEMNNKTLKNWQSCDLLWHQAKKKKSRPTAYITLNYTVHGTVPCLPHRVN